MICFGSGEPKSKEFSQARPAQKMTESQFLTVFYRDVVRFQRTDQVVAYAGLDIEVKESGKWKGQAKLSKRGSGRLRRILYLAAMRSIHLDGSAFGAYYQRLVARGLKKRDALMGVMRKMLIVAMHLLKTGEEYDPSRVASVCGG